MSVDTLKPGAGSVVLLQPAAATAVPGAGAGSNGTNGAAAATNGHGHDAATNGGHDPSATTAPSSPRSSPSDDLADNVDPEVNIVISNTMCTFSVRCHLNLRDIALNGANVEFRKENQVRGGTRKERI